MTISKNTFTLNDTPDNDLLTLQFLSAFKQGFGVL